MKCLPIWVINCVCFNRLKMGQFWHDLFVSVSCLSYLCSFNNNSTHMLLLCNLNAVCIWLGTKCDEWGCVWVTEWMNGWMNELPTVFLCDECDVWVWFISGDYFNWYEWLCDWFLFQYLTVWLIHYNCSIFLSFIVAFYWIILFKGWSKLWQNWQMLLKCFDIVKYELVKIS